MSSQFVWQTQAGHVTRLPWDREIVEVLRWVSPSIFCLCALGAWNSLKETWARVDSGWPWHLVGGVAGTLCEQWSWPERGMGFFWVPYYRAWAQNLDSADSLRELSISVPQPPWGACLNFWTQWVFKSIGTMHRLNIPNPEIPTSRLKWEMPCVYVMDATWILVCAWAPLSRYFTLEMQTFQKPKDFEMQTVSGSQRDPVCGNTPVPCSSARGWRHPSNKS